MDSKNANAGDVSRDKYPLISTINVGTPKSAVEAMEMVKADPSLVSEVDEQGNTPLHYAVAQHHLELIKWLIEHKASIDARNSEQKTAGDWFQLFFASTYSFKLASAKDVRESIEHNSEKPIKQYLLGGVPSALRFSQAKTLLHWAIEYQRIKIVKLILEEMDYEGIKKLLNLNDSQGVTPLTLAEENCRLDSKRKVTQEILDYIKEKQWTIRPMLQTQWVPPPSFEPIGVEQDKLQKLERLFTHRFRQGDIKALEHLRPTIVKLAYNVCYQVYFYCINRIPVRHPRCSGKTAFSTEEFLECLFGTWKNRNQQIFNGKFFSVLVYLRQLLTQEQADQVIQFSDKNQPTKGWSSPGTDEIFINARAKINSMDIVATLIHEATHRADRSYDFFRAEYSLNGQDLSINLEKAYQLAATGASKLLTPEKKRLFEVRQLFEGGYVSGWENELHHWMALHSAETLTIAILALATLPTGFAQYESQPKPALVIKPRFLQTLCGVAAPAQPPAPERSFLFWPGGAKRHTVSSSERSDQAARPVTANSDSGISSAGSSTQMEWSETNAQASLSHLTQKMVSTPPPPPPTTVASLALSPEALPATQARNPASLACPANGPKPTDNGIIN